MDRAFAFTEPQPVLLDDSEPVTVGVYPAGVGYPVTDVHDDDGETWVTISLPTADEPIESEFPDYVGQFVDHADGPKPEIVSIEEAARRFPEFLSPEDVEAFAEAERLRDEWR